MDIMEIEKNRDVRDTLSTDFQVVLIHLLNRVLKENSIEDASKRRRICEMFSEVGADFFDQGWFTSEEHDGGKTCPLLCFAKRKSWSDNDAGEVTKMILPDPTSFLYESSSQNCEWYFDEQEETLGGITVGSC